MFLPPPRSILKIKELTTKTDYVKFWLILSASSQAFFKVEPNKVNSEVKARNRNQFQRDEWNTVWEQAC